MILWGMTNVEKSFADDGDDLGFANLESFVRSGVKGKFCLCPLKNGLADRAPLRFWGYFGDYSSWPVACCVLQGDVNVAIHLSLLIDDKPNNSSSCPHSVLYSQP
jgi:hypothetical protein